MIHYFDADALPREWACSKALPRLLNEEMQIVRVRGERRTARLMLDGRSFFIRLYGRAPRREYWKSWLSLRAPVTDAGPESRALLRLASAGVPAPRLVAYQQGSELQGKGVRSMLLMTDIGEHMDLAALASRWLHGAPPPTARRSLIRAVGELVGRMHKAGVNHRDLYLFHLAQPTKGGHPIKGTALFLLDLHRAQVRARVPRRWLIKDLGSLWFSALGLAPRRLDLLRFLRSYDPCNWRYLARDAGFGRALRRRARALLAESWRKGCAPEGAPPIFPTDAIGAGPGE